MYSSAIQVHTLSSLTVLHSKLDSNRTKYHWKKCIISIVCCIKYMFIYYLRMYASLSAAASCLFEAATFFLASEWVFSLLQTLARFLFEQNREVLIGLCKLLRLIPKNLAQNFLFCLKYSHSLPVDTHIPGKRAMHYAYYHDAYWPLFSYLPTPFREMAWI